MWSGRLERADLVREVGATTVTWIVASTNKAGSQQVMLKDEIDVSDPPSDLLAGKYDLALALDRKPGM